MKRHWSVTYLAGPTCILFLTLLMACGQARAQAAPLQVGLDSNYPPFSLEDRRGHHMGFDLEVAGELCRAMNRRCEFVFRPLDGLLQLMQAGRLDLLMGVSETDERRVYMDFSNPYFRARSSYFGKNGDSDTKRDVTRIGARGGSVQMGHVLNRRGERTEIVYDAFGRLLDMLCAGELDMVLANDLAGYTFLLSERGQDFDALGDPLPLESFPSVVCIGVRKGENALRDSLNLAIRDIRFSGAFGRINHNYFPYTLY